MVLGIVIGGIATATWGLIILYNKASRENPAALAETVRTARQVTGVVMALGTAARAVLDALALVQRAAAALSSTTPSSQYAEPIRFGTKESVA